MMKNLISINRINPILCCNIPEGILQHKFLNLFASEFNMWLDFTSLISFIMIIVDWGRIFIFFDMTFGFL